MSCPTCGSPAPATAVSCPRCGRPLALAVSASAPAPGVYAADTLPPAPPLPYAAAPYAASPVPAAPSKTPGIALVLELLIPGAGALYAGRVLVGLTWLVASAVGVVAAYYALAPALASASKATTDPLAYATSQPLALAAVGVALVWLLLRCALAASYARAFNARSRSGAAPYLAGSGAVARSGAAVDVTAGQRLKTIATVVVEMIPGGLGPYGIGDLVTALESLAGRTMDGVKLTPFERLLYLGASAIPVVPARPFISVYRWFVKHDN